MHTKPRAQEIAACRPWLEAEITVVQPQMLIALGATAAQSLLGSAFRITKEHGKIFPSQWAPLTMATYHPSAILRAPDADARQKMRAEFRQDVYDASQRIKAIAAD